MPLFRARAPERVGVAWSFRARAAVDVLSRGARLGLWVKRLGRGLLIDLILRWDAKVGDGSCATAAKQGRDGLDDGRRKDGGKIPQLRGALGGIL